ncbi:glycosyltransferase family 4 protein [Marivita sp. GX14005]|uniref:glycosyltransferase family 4 protein n=1 Tax=Marivita sp. GX14005 TaxID=2942276 RepID=UPI002019C72C|nr:glycosyltransferase family 4 protein [Marivita sp. GX14005]MCL3883147.1 glycosyltransferase family 4 protein [Marivita sp. GX14005]
MRIAYVCTDPGIPCFGTKGASIHVQEMLRAFVSRGAEVTLISPNLSGTVPADLRAVRHVALSGLPKGDRAARERALIELNGAVEAALIAQGPFDMVYERHALFAHAAMEWASQSGIPGILEINAPLIEEQQRHRSLALPSEAEASARRAITAAETVSAVSPEVGRYARSLGSLNVRVIPNAVNPARFPARQPAEGPFTVGFLGTLKPWHDVATLIDAFALLRAGPAPDARLLIVGDGPERAGYEARLAALGLAHAAEFTGALGAAEVPEALSRMHVAAAPYSGAQEFYFSPLKLYEYMAAGLPVVASRVGHLDEVVAHGRTGLLCPPDDADALAAAFTRLAEAPDMRARLGRTARAEVLAHHTWDNVAAQIFRCAGFFMAEAA